MRVFFLTWCLMKLSHRSAGFLTAGFRWCPAVVQAAAEVWAVCSCPPQKEENSLLFLGHVVPLGGMLPGSGSTEFVWGVQVGI